MNIDELIKRRKAIGATLEQVAAAAGVKTSTVSRWERRVIKNPHQVMFRAWQHAIEDLEAQHNSRGPEAA